MYLEISIVRVSCSVGCQFLIEEIGTLVTFSTMGLREDLLIGVLFLM